MWFIIIRLPTITQTPKINHKHMKDISMRATTFTQLIKVMFLKVCRRERNVKHLLHTNNWRAPHRLPSEDTDQETSRQLL